MDISEKKYLRGEIHDIGELEAEGSEQRGNRPVLIVSCNEFNEYSPEVVILFITSQLLSHIVKGVRQLFQFIACIYLNFI